MERMKTTEAIDMLKKDGVTVTAEEAELILEFIYTMAEITVAQCLREQHNTNIETKNLTQI